MRERFGVPGRREDSMGAPGNVGLAHEAALRVGAGTDLMDQAWWSPGLTHPDGRSAFALWFTGGIFVNQDGRRFVNESAPYDRIGRAIISQMEAGELELPYWMVYDDREGEVPPVKATNVSMVDTASYQSSRIMAHPQPHWRSWPRSSACRPPIWWRPSSGTTRWWPRAPTAISAAVTRPTTVPSPRASHRWHRSTRPPFHAAVFGLSDLGTKGGLRTDAHAQVLDTSGEPIPGLYAAGNTMAAVSGTTYPGGGNPIGASLLFSHLAAMHLAGTEPR